MNNMDLDVSRSEVRQSGVDKQVFELNTARRDGIILQIHHTVPGQNGEIRRIRFIQTAFSDTGEQLAAADHRGNLFMIDLASSKFWLLHNAGSCTSLAFSPYKVNVVLCAVTTGTIHILNTETGKKTGSLVGLSTPVTQMSFAKNRYCLTASSQEAVIWDLASNIRVHRLSMRSDVLMKKVLFMPGTNCILACFHDDEMHIWKFETLEMIKQIMPNAWKSHHIKTIAVTRNGRAMVIGGHCPTLVIFSIDDWTVKKVVDLPEEIPGATQVEFVPQLFDGGANRILAILSPNCKVHFLDTETYKFLGGTIQPGSSIRMFSCSPTGKYLAIILRSGEINIYSSKKVIESKQLVQHIEEPMSRETERIKPDQFKAAQQRTKAAVMNHLEKVHEQIQKTLDLQSLRPILKEFGDYPESYRALIWKSILKVPRNQDAFIGLAKRDCHSAYVKLYKQYPLENKAMLKNLQRQLSCLAYWCPLFAEVKYLPLFVFPFVKVFKNDPFTCFEAVITVLVNWCQYWFEYYPFPPVNVLSMIENVLNEHDPVLLQLFIDAGITSRVYAWSLLEVAFSEVLSSSEWLKFWDHVLSNEPSFLLMAVVAYNITCRAALQSCKTSADFEFFFHNQNPIDMKSFLSKTYNLCKKTNEEIHPRQYLNEFKPLSKGSYPVFTQYPKFIVDNQVQQMQRLRQEEEHLLQKQRVAQEERVAQEWRIKEETRADVQEARLRKLEEAYRDTILKEEERLAEKRKKIINIRRDVRSKELMLLDTAREKIMSQQVQQRKSALDRLLEDIAHKRVQEDSEMALVEDEIRDHHTGLMIQKRKLEEQAGFSLEAAPAPIFENSILQQQQEKLKMELLRLQEEASSKRHSRHTEMAARITALDNLLLRVEVELAKEVVERQNHLVSSERNIKIMQLEKETKSLEMEVEQMLEKLAQIHLLESKSKLQEVAKSFSDRQELNQEQEDLFKAFRDLRTEIPPKMTQRTNFEKTDGWLTDYLNKNGSSDSSSTEAIDNLNKIKNISKETKQPKWIRSSDSTDIKGPHPSYASSFYDGSPRFKCGKSTLENAMKVREQLCAGSIKFSK